MGVVRNGLTSHHPRRLIAYMEGAVCRTLFDGPRIRLAELTCPRKGGAWGRVDVIGNHANITFPRSCAVIARSGQQRVVASPNHVLFYAPNQEYCRWPVDEQGWSCTYLAVENEALSDALEHSGLTALTDGPIDRRTYFVQYAAVKESASRTADRLLIEELLYYLLEAAINAGSRQQSFPGRHARTRRAHRELVEEAKRMLAVRIGERLSVEDLARALYVSPFHLARVFRAYTGYTLHTYRNELRVRRALDQIGERKGDLTSLAHELGFVSLSHFSDNFRNAFGVRPSAVPRLRAVSI